MTASTSMPWRDGLRYGALGAPLAFVALPLYVQWPAFAAPAMGLSLTTLGLLLLVMRCLDAAVDPWLGRRADLWLSRPRASAIRVLGASACAMALGFAALFLAPGVVVMGPDQWVWWSAGALALTYVAFSVLQIVHQAWGARLGGDAGLRSRVVGARELCALAGVLVASVAPSVVGWTATTAMLAVLLVVGLWLLAHAPSARPMAQAVSMQPSLKAPAAPEAASAEGLLTPWRHHEFRALIAVFVLNGLASAVPATLVLFFVRDRLQLQAYEGLFLGAYFLAAAVSVPVWTRIVPRIGLVRAWALGMVMAMLVFVMAAWLGPGDAVGFALVCIGSGLALGADLVAPASLLAGALQRAGLSQRGEGLWFGWWNLVSKLNLALAAGIALPLVQLLGYEAGRRDEASVQALVWVYALLPCAVKALALAALMLQRWREPHPHPHARDARLEVRT